MKVLKFHQFVSIDKGAVNSVIVDLLKGELFQVPNDYIEKFEKRDYKNISQFIEFLKEEELVIEVPKKRWVPGTDFFQLKKGEIRILTLEIEEGIDLSLITTLFNEYYVKRIFYYGANCPQEIIPGVKVINKSKSFSSCKAVCRVTEDFNKINKYEYFFNKRYNSCWGGRVAITSDGNVKPCIYSNIVIGNINADTIENMLECARKYWEITKDKVEKCRDCELRYICFDCREIPMREEGDLFSANTYCLYNPSTGLWEHSE